MKKFITILLFSLTFLLLNSAKAQTTIGETYVYMPFFPNQRVICRDGKGIIHVVWKKDSVTISYANSSDNGLTWNVNDTIVNSTGSKGFPSISCDGNNITIAYRNGTSGVVIYISNNNGESFEEKVPYTSGIGEYVSVERRGQRIYVVYKDDESYSDIEFFNSNDGGNTWGPKKVIFNGFFIPRWGSVIYFEPSLSVDGNGGANDRIHVATSAKITEIGYPPQPPESRSKESILAGSIIFVPDSGISLAEDALASYSISYKNSPDSGVSWSAEKTLAFSDTVSFYMPSITHNGSKVYVSYYSSDNKIYSTSSSDYGSTWTEKRIDTIKDLSKAQYPSIGLDSEGLPVIVWQQNDITNNKPWNLIMRKFDGINWIPEEGYWITEDSTINNEYPNLNFKSNEIAEFVAKRGNNIVYHKITGFFEKITLLPGTAKFKILAPISYPEIKLAGDRKYLNIFWKAGYRGVEKREIAIKCFLNCFNVGDNIESSCLGYQNCTSLTLAFTQAVCTIPEPQYNFTNLNLVVCKLFDPFIPNVEYNLNTTFWALNFSILPVKNISSTVGSSIVLPLTLRNLGLLEDTYQINITPLTNPNFISIKDNLISLKVKSNDLSLQNIKITPLFSTSIELGIWAYSTSQEWFDCNNCPSGFVCEASSGKCSKYISLKIESGNSSLSEISSLEIIFLILIALFLIYKGL